MKIRSPDQDIPSILLLDDENQIHSSVRLRLGDNYRLVNAFNPTDALAFIAREPLDLCIVDVQLPGMDGLTFIQAAKKIDPALGYVIFSGFDSDENLRRAIPLQVLEFLSKPLPERSQFERVLPDWIEWTRSRRKELALATDAATLVRDLDMAHIEREVEATASESAREALFQTAGKLTTAQALLLNTAHVLEPAMKLDPKFSQALRSLREARNQVDAASSVTDEYFSSAYANRDSSAAIVDPCCRHAIAIAQRLVHGGPDQQSVDHRTLGREVAIAGLTGMDFLTLLVPVIVQALRLATPGTTSRVQCDSLARLDEAHRGMRGQDFMWINRRNALLSSPGILLSILANADALLESEATNWLKGNTNDRLKISIRGLISGIQKGKGLAGVAIRPHCQRLEIVVALPCVNTFIYRFHHQKSGMILFVCNSNREAAALTTVCDHRSWAAYSCTTIREFRSLTAKTQPCAIVVRHRLIDGYSDDIFAALREAPLRLRPKVIVLMSADRSAQTEARQIALGADCALHDPVRMEILFEYLAKYRLPAETPAKLSKRIRTSFSIAGVEVYPDEHRIARGKLSHHIAPQEVSLLRILSIAANEVVPYPVLYGELFGRRFDGDTSNCRVLLCKVLASFQLLRVGLKPFIQVIPKSGYLYSPCPAKSRPKSSHSMAQVKAPGKTTKFQKPGNPVPPNR